MAKNDLYIDIFGTNFTISANEEPEYLKNLLDKYRQTIENVKKKTGLKDPLKIAVLTGFLLSDDLEKAGIAKENEEQKKLGEAEELALGLISKLDKTLLTGIAPNITGGDKPSEPEKEEAPPPEKEAQQTEDKPLQEESYLPEKKSFYKLFNTVKHYTWGSADWIPALVEQRNISRIPWAEYWMGVHPSGPSRLESGHLLSKLIEGEDKDPSGEEKSGSYSALPFLFKILAAAKPLSIQTHSSADMAREGFNRENKKNIPLDAKNRSYRDPNGKNEIYCALSPSAALCGFRDSGEIAFLVEILSQGSDGAIRNIFGKLLTALKQEEENPIKAFLTVLYEMNGEESRSFITYIMRQQKQLVVDFPEYKGEWGLCAYLASFFPADAGIIAPLYMNIVELTPGDAIYLPSGIIHSYIKGMGLELTENSDNVLRGGLSSKHIDHTEFLLNLNYQSYKPAVIKAPKEPLPSFTYRFPCDDFYLSVKSGRNGNVKYSEPGPSIMLLKDGAAVISDAEDKNIQVSKGDSVFIPYGSELQLSGTFTAYIASAGKA